MSVSEWYFLIRDDAPMFVERHKGWNGSTPNPLCFNCEHTLARHFPDPPERVGWDHARAKGMINCRCDQMTGIAEFCGCDHYEPSFAKGD